VLNDAAVPLTFSDVLAVTGLVVGLVGGIVGIVGLALTLWIYGKAQQVNAAMLKAQTDIEATTNVLKGLVDGLLGTTVAHVTKQNEAMVQKFMSLEQRVAKSPGEEDAKSPDVQIGELHDWMRNLTDLVLEDLRERRAAAAVPLWMEPPSALSNAIRRRLGPPDLPPEVPPSWQPSKPSEPNEA
jgi:hypothetical protein